MEKRERVSNGKILSSPNSLSALLWHVARQSYDVQCPLVVCVSNPSVYMMTSLSPHKQEVSVLFFVVFFSSKPRPCRELCGGSFSCPPHWAQAFLIWIVWTHFELCCLGQPTHCPTGCVCTVDTRGTFSLQTFIHIRWFSLTPTGW